jgi:hypothetical protein
MVAAAMLGVVNDEVQRRSDDARSGRNPVHAENHVLLLNWNNNSSALLQNIATAVSTSTAFPGSRSRNNIWADQPTVVVLADKSKSDMDAAVQECIK